MLTRFNKTDENKAALGLDSTPQAHGNTGGNCSRDRLCRFGKCVVHDWCLDPSGWRNDRGLAEGRDYAICMRVLKRLATAGVVSESTPRITRGPSLLEILRAGLLSPASPMLEPRSGYSATLHRPIETTALIRADSRLLPVVIH